jgi:hypothetical protein
MMTIGIVAITHPMAASSTKPRHIDGPETVTYVNGYREFKGPLAFKDNETGTVFYIESDGRHVAAITSDGKILWIRNPFVDGKLKPYRYENPLIVQIGKADVSIDRQRHGRFLFISFNSTQSGVLNMADGKFTFMGQD